MSQTRFINPDALSKPPGYTHVVEATAPARIVYIAGQLGIDRDGKVAGDFRQQAVQTFENLKNALAAVGGQFRHVVKLNNYLVDLTRPADLPPGARRLSGRRGSPGEHDHRDFGPGARGRAPRGRGGRGAAGRRAIQGRIQGRRQRKQRAPG